MTMPNQMLQRARSEKIVSKQPDNVHTISSHLFHISSPNQRLRGRNGIPGLIATQSVMPPKAFIAI